jgi:hypothetical protein
MMISSKLPDACQNHFPGDFPAVHPYQVTPEGVSLRAEYSCPFCGIKWTCWWDAKAAGWPTRS